MHQTFSLNSVNQSHLSLSISHTCLCQYSYLTLPINLIFLDKLITHYRSHLPWQAYHTLSISRTFLCQYSNLTLPINFTFPDKLITQSHLPQGFSMESPAISAAFILHPDIPAVCDAMNCAHFPNVLQEHRQNQWIMKELTDMKTFWNTQITTNNHATATDFI